MGYVIENLPAKVARETEIIISHGTAFFLPIAVWKVPMSSFKETYCCNTSSIKCTYTGCACIVSIVFTLIHLSSENEVIKEDDQCCEHSVLNEIISDK